MGFKLGREKGLQADAGEIKSKFSFKTDGSYIPNVPVIRKDLAEGILGEANGDGSIYIDNSIKPGSNAEREVLNHEMKHLTDMRIGKTTYTDNYIKHEGVTYPRKDGKIKLNGKWVPEGSPECPWEKH